MGSELYSYFVPYEQDLQGALDHLRDEEFAAGRYYYPRDEVDWADQRFLKSRPVKRPQSIDEAIQAAGPTGTRSILDITSIGETPDCGVAAPLEKQMLVTLYGTDQPSPEDVQQDMGFLKHIDRGTCRYIVLYREGKPIEICFVGYSYD